MSSRFASVVTRKAFAGQVSLLDAYRWDRKNFFTFLREVEKHPATFGIAKEVQVDALKVIKLVTEFDYDSTLRVFTKPGAGSTSPAIIDPQEFRWQGVPTKFFGVYDSLGYLTSLMGSAPLSATKEDYYLPLLATYTKWCLVLAGDLKRAPSRTFIAYNERSFEQSPILLSIDAPEKVSSPPNEYDVALGANIGGAGIHKNGIQINNWNWMRVQGKLNLGTDPGKSIIRPDPNGVGQLFGHCAETIPLVITLL